MYSLITFQTMIFRILYSFLQTVPQGIISKVIWDQRWSRDSFGASAGLNKVGEERLDKVKCQTRRLLLSSLSSPSRSLNTEPPRQQQPLSFPPSHAESNPRYATPSITPRDYKHSNASPSRPGHARSSSEGPVQAPCEKLCNCKSTL